jgi:type IX secretion system PorP/SprF family membrane protein
MVMGQLYPLWDQYVNNTLAINPAFAGSHNALSATTLYRNQWVGFKGALTNQALSVHSPVYSERIGLGLMVEVNNIGIYKITNFIGNYAYRMELRDGTLSLGAGFGTSLYSMAWNELNAVDDDDVLLMNNPTSYLFPNFSLGTYYYTDNYFLGFSLPMFLSHEPDHSNGNYRTKNLPGGYNYFFTGGYWLDIGPQFDLLPSVLLKYHPGHAPQIDLNAQIILQDILWFGIGYRSRSSLIGTFQCQLNYQLRLGYSYSFDMGPIGRYTNGSHEFMLNYVFRYKQFITGPRKFGLT